MKNFVWKKTSLFIGIFASIPAILNLYLISKFAINTVFWDEWEIVSIIQTYYQHEDWLSLLIIPYNGHIMFFPKIIMLFTDLVSSFNVITEMIIGWIFLFLALFFYWFLVKETIHNLKWLIIPISFVLFSFSQFENTLWGWASIHWNLTILLVVAGIYFLNKIENSRISFILFVGICVIASFTIIGGLLLLVLGLCKIKKISRIKTIILLVIIITVLIFFARSSAPGTPEFIVHELNIEQYDLGKMINYLLVYFGSGFKIAVQNDPISIPFATIIGSILLSMFTLVGIKYHKEKRNQLFKVNLQPWFFLVMFSILFAIMTVFARIDLGIEQALSPRYTPISNLAFVGIMVIILTTINHISKNKKSKFWKLFKFILILFLAIIILGISVQYISGYIGSKMFHDKIMKDSNCILNYESTTSYDCLYRFYPDIPRITERAKILDELCFGPFVVKCSR